jgi:glutathione peroxidase
VSEFVSIQTVPVKRIDGTPATLAEYAGKVVLVVNVASKCGYTPQYAGLEALYQEKRGEGLVICGFPANDFSEQEPGANAEIQSFCQLNYGVSFPMYAKTVVTGNERHPLYSALIESKPDATGDQAELREHLVDFGAIPTKAPEVLWNFEKFLIGRDGRVVGRFSPDVTPEDGRLREAVEAELVRG